MANAKRKTSPIQNKRYDQEPPLHIRLNYVTSVPVIAKESKVWDETNEMKTNLGCAAQEPKKFHGKSVYL